MAKTKSFNLSKLGVPYPVTTGMISYRHVITSFSHQDPIQQ